MNTERTITGMSALAVMLALVVSAGCKGSDTPKTVAADRPLDMATSEHGLSPNYLGLVKEYGAVLAEDPHNLVATIGMGNALFEAGQWRDAIEYYDRALRLNPHNADVVTDKGTCFRNMGMTDEAIREYKQALRIDPKHQNALFNLGIIYSHDKKDLAKAKEYWEQLLRIAPMHPQADYIRESLESFRRTPKGGAP